MLAPLKPLFATKKAPFLLNRMPLRSFRRLEQIRGLLFSSLSDGLDLLFPRIHLLCFQVDLFGHNVFDIVVFLACGLLSRV
jgi:hypothetical protein